MPPSIAAILFAFANAQQAAPVIQADLVDAAKTMEVIEYCENPPSSLALQERYSKLGKRYYKALFRAAGLFGNDIDPNAAVALSNPRSVRRCAERYFAPVEQRSQAALSRAESRLTQAERPTTQGLWFGLFPVCRQTVAEVAVRRSPGTPATLFIEFIDAGADAFRAYSASFVGGAIVRDMTVTLDGFVEAKVPVYEPVSGLQLSGPSEADLNAMMRAARSDCVVRLTLT